MAARRVMEKPEAMVKSVMVSLRTLVNLEVDLPSTDPAKAGDKRGKKSYKRKDSKKKQT